MTTPTKPPIKPASYLVRAYKNEGAHMHLLFVYETRRFTDIAGALSALVHVLQPDKPLITAYFFIATDDSEILLHSLTCHAEELIPVLFPKTLTQLNEIKNNG